MKRETWMHAIAPLALALALVALALSVLALALALHGRASVETVTVTRPVPVLRPESDSGSSCGVERAAVKHLTDGFTLGKPVARTIDQLVALHPPPVTQDSPRIRKWDSRPVADGGWGPAPTPPPFVPEGRLVQLTAVHVVAAKQEADSDLHVIVEADFSHAQMNVEIPAAKCDQSSPYAFRLATARAHAEALEPVSSQHYTPEDVRATIRGTVFYDVLHGQRGAPNGVELHPVTMFNIVK